MRRAVRLAFIAAFSGWLTFVLLIVYFTPESFLRLFRGREAVFGLANRPAYKIGDKFPDLDGLKTAEGQSFRLSDHPHQVLLVNYFASW